MRTALIIVLSFIHVAISAQHRRFPPIEFRSKASKASPELYASLQADSTKDLVIAFHNVNNYASYSGRLYVVHKPNGRVVLFHSSKRGNRIPEPELRMVHLNRMRSKEWRKLLWSTYMATQFELYQDSLNLTTIPDPRGFDLSMSVEDGSQYRMWIRGPQGYSSYASYSPEEFIQNKCTGWRVRQRFMEIWNGYFNELRNEIQ